MSSNERYYIGGGNIGGIAGLSPHRTPMDEFHVITGKAPELDKSTLTFFKRRKSLEPYIATLLEEHNLTVLRQNERYIDTEFPFMKAEIDAETTDGFNSEFKSVHPLAAKAWGLDGHDDGAPDYVTAQAQWGLGIKRPGADPVKFCRILAAIGLDESRLYPVQRADDVIGWLREEARAFWENHVLKLVMPPPRTVDDILSYIKPDPNKVIEATDINGLAADVSDFIELRTVAKDAEAKVEAVKTRIQLLMVDATTLTLEGNKVLTWKQNKDSAVTDYKEATARLSALVAANDAAEIIINVTKDKPGNRVFRLAAAKN